MTSTWSKAPDFADSPARVEAVRAQTEVDLQTYLEGGLQRVECRSCHACVLVRKNSYKHTSIQWQADPAAVCPEFSDATPASRRSCSRLAASIDHAVLEGIVEVRDTES
ncbi:hypothetical protein ACFYVR_05915 [Rhodococcus sp. NPDC003318]|uniref:hypothetical protein n=1 Tax=Rhodococcus sp. NPDC003318 TaxID=3364503 RepID=UPI0036CAB6C4